MHFSVAVFTEQNGATIDELLAPYDESLIVPHYISKEEIIARVRADIERTRKLYDEYLKDPVKYEETHHNKSHIEYLTTQFPKELEWDDEECYAEGLKYYNNEQLRPDGSVYENFNPNAQWDWYSIGGRFEDTLPLKSGGFATKAHAKDVTSGYYKDREEYETALDFWKTYIDGEQTSDEAKSFTIQNREYYRNRFKTAESYASYMSRLGFQVMLLPSGEWIEAEVKTWDLTAEEYEVWEAKCVEMLKRAVGNDWDITIVDCHI